MNGEEFKEIRLSMGFDSAVEFASYIGVSHMAIYNWENGVTPIKRPTELLMRLLQVSSKQKLIKVGFYEA